MNRTVNLLILWKGESQYCFLKCVGPTWLELGNSILNELKFYVASWKLCLSIKFHILFLHFKVLLFKTQNKQGSH